MRARTVMMLAATLTGAATAFSACSLGLDEAKINGTDGSAGDVITLPDIGPVPEGGNPVQCNVDNDCKPANACLTGKCDTTRRMCAYTICATPMTCQASVCDNNTKTCSVPTKYTFHAGNFHIATGSIGCGGGGAGARKCFAAQYPFVFVGTTNGVVARSVADPTDNGSDVVQVGGLPFFPAFVVSSGTRVYFVGSVGGSGPDYKVPMGWVDAPTDPTIKTITAQAVFNTLQVPSIDAVYPDSKGGIYLVRADSAKSFPVAHVAAPFKDLDAIQFFPLAGIPQNAAPVGGSGTRIVTFVNVGQYQNNFSIENNAASGGAQNAGNQDITSTLGNVSGPFYVAHGSDGSLVWTGNGLVLNDAGGGNTAAVRVAWVLSDQMANTFDGTARVDVEAYGPQPGVGGDFPGPLAVIDQKHVLVVSAPNSNLAQSSVQIANREGASPAITMNRKFVLPFHPSELGAAASNGFGYVLTPDQVSGANVHVFASTCDN